MAWEQRAFMSFVFCCLLQTMSHSSHVIFNFSHSYFHARGRHVRGIWTDCLLRFSALGLKWASSVSLHNSDMRLQSFVRATPSCPVSQRCLYFHAEWQWWHWWKVCRTTWNPKQRKCGLARVVTDPELEGKMLDLSFLLNWDHSLVSETKGKLYTNTYAHLSPLYEWGGSKVYQLGGPASSEMQMEKSEFWAFKWKCRYNSTELVQLSQYRDRFSFTCNNNKYLMKTVFQGLV